MSTTLDTELAPAGMLCRNDAGTIRWYIIYDAADRTYTVSAHGPNPHKRMLDRKWLTLEAAEFAALALEADDIERTRREG